LALGMQVAAQVDMPLPVSVNSNGLL